MEDSKGSQMEMLIRNACKNLDSLSLNDKAVRVRNLWKNIEKVSGWNFIPSQINSHPSLCLLLSQVQQNFGEMSRSNKMHYLAALAFFQIQNPTFCEQVCQDVKSGEFKLKTAKEYSDLLLFLAKSRYTDLEILSQIEIRLLAREEPPPLKTLVNEFWAFGVLGYYEESREFAQQFDKIVLETIHKQEEGEEQSEPFSLEFISKSLYTYSLIKTDLDLQILKLLLSQLVPQISVEDPENVKNNVNEQFFHCMTVILQSLANLGIKNTAILENFIHQCLLTKQNGEGEVPLKSKECAVIMASIVKLKAYKFDFSFDFFESQFLEDSQGASTDTVATMLLSHNKWAVFLRENAEEVQAGMSSLSHFKKRHIKFVEKCLNLILEKGPETLNLKSLFYILKFGNLKNFKKRSNSKLIFEIGMAGISQIPRYLEEIPEDQHQQVVIDYYYELCQTARNRGNEKLAAEKLKQIGFDLESIIDSEVDETDFYGQQSMQNPSEVSETPKIQL